MGSGPLAVTCSLITVVFILLPIAWYRRGCLKALMEVPASSTWWLTGASRRRMWGILVFRGATFIMMLVIQIVQFAYRGVGVLRFLTVIDSSCRNEETQNKKPIIKQPNTKANCAHYKKQ
uniref:Uncharacterized protein n=1 Tax=Lotharella globosa TaxID=91324 RepID=A0A7S3YUH0_9EUKA